MTHRTSLGAAASVLLAASATFAQPTLSTATIDAIPASPAFAILNASPQEVIRPTTPREFGAALLNGVDPNGNYQNGLALDFTPYMAFAGHTLSLKRYQDDWFIRALANTQFSFATTSGESSDDKSLKVAGGIHTTLWNAADPRLDKVHIECIRKEVENISSAPPPPPPPLPVAGSTSSTSAAPAGNGAPQSEFSKNVQKCHEELRQRHWSASAWSVGLAGIGTSKDGSVDDTRYGGSGAWMSYSQDLGNFMPGLADFRGQFTVHARWRDNQFVPDPATKGNLIRQDAAIAAAELRLGTSELNFSLESSYLNTSTKGRGHDEFFQFTVAAEYHLFDNIWFNLAVGGTSGREGGRDDGFVLGKFKYGFDSKPAGQPAAQK